MGEDGGHTQTHMTRGTDAPQENYIKWHTIKNKQLRPRQNCSYALIKERWIHPRKWNPRSPFSRHYVTPDRVYTNWPHDTSNINNVAENQIASHVDTDPSLSPSFLTSLCRCPWCRQLWPMSAPTERPSRLPPFCPVPAGAAAPGKFDP